MTQENVNQPKSKPGPKGRALEPFAGQILAMYRTGHSIQSIVDWLRDEHGVTITRQSMTAWIKTRIALLIKRTEELKAIDFEALGVVMTMTPPGRVARGEARLRRGDQQESQVHPAPATAPSSDPEVSVAADGVQRINVRRSSAAFVPPTEGTADAEPQETSGKRSDRLKPAKLF